MEQVKYSAEGRANNKDDENTTEASLNEHMEGAENGDEQHRKNEPTPAEVETTDLMEQVKKSAEEGDNDRNDDKTTGDSVSEHKEGKENGDEQEGKNEPTSAEVETNVMEEVKNLVEDGYNDAHDDKTTDDSVNEHVKETQNGDKQQVINETTLAEAETNNVMGQVYNSGEKVDNDKHDEKTTVHSVNVHKEETAQQQEKDENTTTDVETKDTMEQIPVETDSRFLNSTPDEETTEDQNQLSEKHAQIHKYTLQYARTVDKHTLTDEELTSHKKIPDYIFKTLMIGNYHVREFEIKPSSPSNEDTIGSNYDLNKKDGENVEVNPMDAILGIFHRSDESLRRYLANKLYSCQLSVPFLLPDPKAPFQNVTLLLSALENITICWEDGSTTQQVFATEHPFPMISFVRIGETKMSKSSLINKIMSDGGNNHDFFFHKDLKGGHIERKVVDGLIELGWFLPGGSEKQTLKNEICFANLRGDAKKFRKQLHLLLKISSVLFILLPSKFQEREDEDLDIPKDILKEATKATGKVILIFKKEVQTDAIGYFKSLKLPLIIKAKEKNEQRFLLCVRQNIQRNIPRKKASPLVELVSHLTEDNIHPDDTSHQLHSYKKFEQSFGSWLELENENAKKFLKLQAHIPALAGLERKKFCAPKCGDVKRVVESINEQIHKEKMAQKESLKQMDTQVLNYFHGIAEMDETRRSYTLNMLKHHLDKMSLQIMPKLHVAYRNALLERGKETEKLDTQSPQEKRLKQLKESISKYSFGLEHIIREIAQLYQLEEIKYDYDGAAADMLLSGQPLEIMDGDSFYIPLRWFNAVFTKLQEKTNDAKQFVISVVGIQSSGKSTMLNTMFGLELPVSAGKCTRGAFASLLPVSDSLKQSSGYDYVLIIDTEGLEGSADSQLRKHDNQLVTFAIGIADVTIVNIYGENQNEMKEFLEIAVHAFLKMNLVEKKKKACKIVHQNVVAADARDKLVDRRLDLKKNLDEMTELAAKQENCEQKYQTFDDLISFDMNEDIFYIPSLLKGNPPMAPVNPEYGRAVQKVKENIINLMLKKDQSLKLSFSQFQDNVGSLWEAMLKENFIFSFRNIIEVRAFTALDRECFNESVNNMVIGMGELQTNIEVALKRCSSQQELSEVWEEKGGEIHKKGKEIERKMKDALNDFITSDQDKAILEQWRENVMKKIETQTEIQVLQVQKNCLSTFNHLQQLQGLDEQKRLRQKELLEKAIALKTSIEDEQKLKATFEQEWKQWIAGVPECQEKKNDVNNEMITVLCHTDPSLTATMEERLQQRNYTISDFKEKPIIDDNNLQYDFGLWGIGAFIEYFINQKKRKCQSEAENIVNVAEEKTRDFVKKASKPDGARCSSNDLTKMYHIVITTIEHETNTAKFKFRESLKCEILLHLFAKRYETFEKMEDRFILERDIRSDLERNFRPKLESYFKSVCSKVKKEVLAATLFFEALEIPIESALNSAMGRAVAKEMLKESKYKSKGQFHASVLIELGEECELNNSTSKECKFELYKSYLESPVSFLRMKLIASAENYSLENGQISIFKEKINVIRDKVLFAISSANEETEKAIESKTLKTKKISFWIEHFVKKCSTLVIKNETFALAEIEELEDIEVFQDEVRKRANCFVDTLIKCGLRRETIPLWHPTPADIIFNEMMGCQSFCPFCKALCDLTTQNHLGKHTTPSHRPEGIIGYKYQATRKLETNICTMNVGSLVRFKNVDTDKEWHPFEQYESVNEYYESWLIPEDTTFEASKYFQWFMTTFSKELAEYHNAEEPDIPEEWKRVNFSDAKEKLKQKYKL